MTDLYAISEGGFRAISRESDLLPGEYASETVPERIFLEARKSDARLRRNALLRASDWTQLPDSPVNVGDMAAWLAYRADLRALPENPDFPDCDWPESPTGHNEVQHPSDS